MTEKEILKRLSVSEHSALELLFEKYFNKLITHVRPILISHDSCQEAIQNTFIKLWEKRVQLDIQTNLYAYLKKMAFHEALMLKRGQKTHSDPDSLDYSAIDYHLEDVIEKNPVYVELETCIRSLPEKILETFRLYRKEGLTQQEISDYLGKAKKTIEAQLSRSLVLLRNCLQSKKN